jgi:teichuronic acid biosynthesis glycosyltransferase TuaC
MSERLRILTFSTLFPNAASPGWGIFVETRLRHLVASGQVESRVIAPVPWFPSKNARFGQYAAFARAPRRETRNGLEVDHPRYPVIPKIGMSVQPALLAAWCVPAVKRLLRSGFDFDLIDAHYYYPDGVAAALLGEWFGRPVVITARGTDINLIPQYELPRRMIRWAARRAAASITVCQALKDEMKGHGIETGNVHVLRNGVDLERFAPRPQAEARAALNLPAGRIALSVGYLIERKGHHLAIEAMAKLPDWTLVVAGDGEMAAELKALAARLGVAARVRFVGAVPQSELATYYSAADVLLLASSREGMANVLLESLACGTPVVATPLWGTPEVIATPESGELMAERSAGALVAAVERLAGRMPRREDTRRYAEGFAWDLTTAGQLELFGRIAGG